MPRPILSPLVQFGPLLAFALVVIIVVAVAKRQRAPWLTAWREWCKSATKIGLAGYTFGFYLVVGALLLAGCLLGMRMGFKPLLYPPLALILWIIYMGTSQAVFSGFILTIKEKPVMDDWLDWPEFADQKLGIVTVSD